MKQTPVASNSYWGDRAIWLLVALAFVVRVVYNLALHPEGHPPSDFVIDEREYFMAAHVLAEGRGFSFYDQALWVRPPLYAASLAAVMAVAGSDYLPALLFQSLLSALTLPALGWLAYRVAGRSAALWSIVLGLLYLPFTLFAGLLLSETLFIFLFAWLLVALLRAREHLQAGWSRSTWLAVLGAGALLGLGVLVRSTALGFLPLVLLWFLWDRGLPARRRVAAASVIGAVCLLALAPWVARNYAAYGRFIPVDTTGGYNLWLGSVGVRDEARLQADLLAIPNPGDRQSHAYSQALANITADPLAFIGKGVKESLDLWLPSFGAEERQVRGYALGRIPEWHLASLFIFDDLLYILILGLGVIGLSLSPANPLKGLTLLWALLWVVAAFVFFAVTRFRLPIVACLVPWAGVGIAMAREWRPRWAALKRPAQAGYALLGALILLVVMPAISVQDTWLGLQRWGEQAPYRRGEALLRENLPAEAAVEYRRANIEVSDTRFGLAAALLQMGEPTEALALLRADEDPDRFEPHIIRGEAARMLGNLDAARSSFQSRVVQVDSQRALQWAWDHLKPAPIDEIQIGSGLDMGYVRGFYGPEADSQGNTYRWATANAEARYLLDDAYEVRVQLNGWRPNSAPDAQPDIRYVPGGMRMSNPPELLSGEDAWVTVTVADVPKYAMIRFQIATEPFVPGGNDPRLLGLRVSTITVGSAP